MIIKKLKLENIKSYVNEEIDFTSGINFILGTNGSGKTTIIESIGLALFNFSKSTQSDMIRYNKTKASIEVDFIANDGMEYRVVRTLRPKTSGSVKIIDVAGNTELYSGVGDVYAFIKTVLKVVRTKDFAKMFEEIIAVPQGQYVAAFLERPSIRKENFDRLFDLHIYKNINTKLTSIASNIKENKILGLKEAIATINGEVKQYDEKKSALAEVINHIKELVKEQEKLDLEISNTLSIKQKLEKNKENLISFKNERTIVEENIKNINKLIASNNEDLKHAKTAQEIVDKNKKGYMKYQDNIEKIAQYEQKYSQYLSVENKLKTKENEILILKNNLVNHEQNKATKQKDFEERHQEIIKHNTESIFLKTDLEKINNTYEKKHAEIYKKIDKISNDKKQLLAMQESLNTYQIRYGERLIKDWTNYNNLDEKLKNVNDKISQINIAKDKYEKVSETRTKLLVELDNAISNSHISRDGNCPFLKEKCKNIDGQSLTEYFSKIIDEKNKEIEEIDNIIYQYKNELIDERKYISELQTLESNKKFLVDYNQSMESLKTDFLNDFRDEISYIDDYDFKHYMDELEVKIKSSIKKLENDEENYNTIKSDLVIEETNINNLKFKIELKKANINDLETVNRKLGVEIESLSGSILMANKSLNFLTKEVERIKEDLISVADSKVMLTSLKEENSSLEEFKNQYIANIAKAKEVDKKLEAINKDQALVEELMLKSKELEIQIIELDNNYSEATYQETTNLYIQLVENKSSIMTSISEKGTQRNKLQNEVYEMDNLFKQRDAKQLQLDCYNEINEFINRAKKIFTDLPRELSIKYREHISNTATKIYRQISKERVQLELTEDYGVIITEDDNQKNQKSIDVLSGGEQMSVAIAIRLSMLKGLTGLDLYFLDEPTVNLDQERRENVADVVGEIADDLKQLFVISHDDTFDQITDTVIKIVKENNESKRG